MKVLLVCLCFVVVPSVSVCKMTTSLTSIATITSIVLVGSYNKKQNKNNYIIII